MNIKLERSSDIPLYIQIRDQIRAAILHGDLVEGRRLPPERQLAAQLGINRTTVVNAYRELAADGLVEGQVGRGTIVSWSYLGNRPDEQARPVAWVQQFASYPQWPHVSLVQEVAESASQPGTISLAGGVPAPECYPVKEFEAAANDFLHAGGIELLANCPAEGWYPFRQWLADWMAEQGIRATPDHILVTSGSTQALDLISRTFLEPDDEVILETPTSMGAYQCFHAARARLLGVPLDAEGMRIEVLQEALARHRVKFIYSLPSFQNPTGITLNPDRRTELLELAQEYGVPVIEDDPYSLLNYGGSPPVPLKALDEHGHVIYLGTLSKLLFPGLRLGWIAAPRPVIERLARIKRNADLFTNTLAQGSAWHLLNRLDLDSYLDRLRNVYRRRRDVLTEALQHYCPTGLRWQTPEGGFYLWLHLPEGLLSRTLLPEARDLGVSFLPGEPFCVDGGGQNRIRLNFSYANPAEIEEGVKRLGTAISNLLERRQASPAGHRSTQAIV